MKILPEDMDAIRTLFHEYWTDEDIEPDERDMSLAFILVRIYDRGYAEGWEDGREEDDPG